MTFIVRQFCTSSREVSVVSSIQSQGGAGAGRRSSCTLKSSRRRYFCRCARVVFGAPILRVQRATVMCECVVFRGEVKCDVEPVWNRLVTGCNRLSLRTGVEKACRLPQLRAAEPLRLYFGPHRRCPMRSSPASRCAVDRSNRLPPAKIPVCRTGWRSVSGSSAVARASGMRSPSSVSSTRRNSGHSKSDVR